MHLRSGKEILSILNTPPPTISEHLENPEKEEYKNEDEGYICRSYEKEKTPTTPPFPQRLENKKFNPTIDALLEGIQNLCEYSLVTSHHGNTNL
jgi:hypothetical protein